MDIGSGWKIVGLLLLIAVAVSFELEDGWAFIGAAILMIAWVVAVLSRAAHSHSE